MTGLTLLLAGLTAAAAAQDAVVRGRVTARPRVTGRVWVDPAYSDPALAAARRLDYKHLKGLVVYAVALDTPSAAAPAPGLVTAEKGWRGWRLTPEFQAVSAGAPVVFRNAGKQRVTVVAGGVSAGSLAVAVGPGAEVNRVLEDVGLYRLSCLEDARGEARVFAAGSHHALAGPEGAYELRLPAGRYSVTAWHERLPPRSEELNLAAGESRSLDFELSVRQLPEVP